MSGAFKKILNLTFFSIAMAFLETAVVVYLRKLYYPEGFDFPLKMMEFSVGQVEFFREAATLVMILTVAFLTGRTKIQKFAAFIFVFAVWDIFYYVFLYFTLGWPSSLLTWDILFLIPVTWVGPVTAPIINSFMMILLAWAVVSAEKNGIQKIILKKDWFFLILGSIVVIIAYTEDFTSFLLNDYSFGKLLKVIYSEEIIQRSLTYKPVDFAWYIFIAGISMHAYVITSIFVRSLKRS